MLTPQEHAQLLRELENVARQFGNLMTDFGDSEEAHEAYALQGRARQAAEEIEGQPQDQQWYAYHPEDGMELFGTSDQAKAQAELWLADDRTAASTDGWHEDQELLAWGYIVPVESAQVTQRYAADETEEGCSSPDFDEYVVYELKPVPPVTASQPSRMWRQYRAVPSPLPPIPEWRMPLPPLESAPVRVWEERWGG